MPDVIIPAAQAADWGTKLRTTIERVEGFGQATPDTTALRALIPVLLGVAAPVSVPVETAATTNTTTGINASGTAAAADSKATA